MIVRFRQLLVVLTVVAVPATVFCATTSAAGVVRQGSTAKPTGTSGEIKIGIQYLKNGAAAERVTGDTGADLAAFDQVPNMYKAAIDQVNENGGVLGKKVVPFFFPYDTAAASASAEEEAFCTRFTQDNKVFAVIVGAFQHSPLSLKCFNDAGVLVLSEAGNISEDAGAFKEFPLYATTTGINMTRLASLYVDGLADQDFFADGAKVGLLRLDDPQQDAAAAAIAKELKKRKIDLVKEIEVPAFRNPADAAAKGIPGIRNAVLAFRDAGVDHVLFMGFVGFASLFLASAAPQDYHPRYGLSSLDAPQSMADTFASIAGTQLKDSVGIGWTPAFDVKDHETNAAGDACDALMGPKGLPTGAAQFAPSWTVCDTVNVFAAAAEAGGKLTPKAVIAGLHKMGKVSPATTFELDFPKGGHDGVAAYRPLAFSADCTCFQYTGPVTKVKKK
jgi:ABC-type branched-subunit amino acid transport system substrate-binding protein